MIYNTTKNNADTLVAINNLIVLVTNFFNLLDRIINDLKKLHVIFKERYKGTLEATKTLPRLFCVFLIPIIVIVIGFKLFQYLINLLIKVIPLLISFTVNFLSYINNSFTIKFPDSWFK